MLKVEILFEIMTEMSKKSVFKIVVVNYIIVIIKNTFLILYMYLLVKLRLTVCQ